MGNTKNDMLNYAIENGMIDLTYIQAQIDMKEREEILSKHPYKIWEGSNGKWYTYLPDEVKGRVLRKRKTEKEIQDLVIAYWKKQEEQDYNPTIKEVFDEWNARRLRLEKISKSSYDRYNQFYDRHYGEFGKNRIKSVDPEEYVEFLEEEVPKKKLTSKAFTGLKTVTRGLLKRAKKRKLITFSVEEIFEDLELTDKDFSYIIKDNAEEVFDELEMPLVIEWIEEQKPSLLNLGILLLFVTGVRIGELASFKWSDWDGYAIHIRRTETRYKDSEGHEVYEIKEFPKTPAGVRTVVIPLSCQWIIKEIRKINPFGEFMFERKTSSRIKTYSFRWRLYRICEKIEIVKKSPHKVRKTYASILLDNKIPEKNVIEQMGHTDISCTKQSYSKNRKTNETKAELLDTIPDFHIAYR